MDEKKLELKLGYDAKNDVLYCSFGDPQEAYSEEVEDGIFARVNPDDRFVGMTVVDFRKRTREIAERGEAIYKEKWEEKLKTEVGKFVAINVNNGDATIGETSEQAVRLAQQKDPKGFFHLMRVGRPAALEAGWYMSHAS